MPERDDDAIAVVGAGMGGLAAAISLAGTGRRVRVFEAMPEAGGKLGRYVVDGGVEVDTGPSVVTLPDVLRQVFARGQARLEDELTLLSLDLATRYRYPDGTVFDTFSDVQKTLAEVGRCLGEDAARELKTFLDYSERIWGEAAPRFVLSPAKGPLALLGLGLTGPRGLFEVDPLRTMRQGIRSRVTNPYLETLLLRFATYNGSDARTCPAPLNSIAHVELGLGVYGIGGGVYELARSLERVARRLGVEFHYRARVSRLLTEGKVVSGLELDDGELHRAAAVVCNADVRHVYRRLLPGHRPLRQAAPSMSGWTGIVKARRRGNRPPHEVLFPTVYEQEMADIFDHRIAPREPTVYLCAQEKAHKRSGWTEHEPLFVMANAPAGMADDQGALEHVVMGRLRAASLLDDDDVVVWRRQPRDLAAAFADTLGALYGAASSTRTAAFLRPKNRATDLKGLYFASGSAHPGGGVPLCLASGMFAADALLEDLPRRRRVA